MIEVEFGYKGKAATKTYIYNKSLKGCNLGDMKPTRAKVFGEDLAVDKVKFDKWIKTVVKAIDEDALLETNVKLGETKKKEKKSGTTGESREGTEVISE